MPVDTIVANPAARGHTFLPILTILERLSISIFYQARFFGHTSFTSGPTSCPSIAYFTILEHLRGLPLYHSLPIFRPFAIYHLYRYYNFTDLTTVVRITS